MTRPRRVSFEGVVILGAGLAGLGALNELPGAQLFEAKAYGGGHAYSHHLAGVAFDEGAHISHTKDLAFLDMIMDAAGPNVHSFEPSIVRNRWNGSWIGYPVQNHLLDLPETLRISALNDLVMAHVKGNSEPPANYREWCEQQYGTFLTDTFYEVFTEKYWRRSTAELATDWLGGRLMPSQIENVIIGAISGTPAPQASFTRFHYPPKGGFYRFFERLFDAVNIHLEHRAKEIRTSQRLIRFENGREVEFDHLVSSIPLPTLIASIIDVPPSVRDAAEKLHHTKLLCVNLVLSTGPLTDAHWVYVYDHDVHAARISFPGNLAPESVGDGFALQAEVFRDHREPWEPDTLVQESTAQLAALLHFHPSRDVTAVKGVTVEHAYIISTPDRAPAVDHITDWLRSVGVFPTGLYGRWRYMWSDQAYRSGQTSAQQVRKAIG